MKGSCDPERNLQRAQLAEARHLFPRIPVIIDGLPPGRVGDAWYGGAGLRLEDLTDEMGRLRCSMDRPSIEVSIQHVNTAARISGKRFLTFSNPLIRLK